MRTYYIQFRYPGQPLETVDEFRGIKEARKMLAEYRLAYSSDSSGELYISTRPCKAWKEAS